MTLKMTRNELIEVTKYRQDGVDYVCAGYADTSEAEAKEAAEAALGTDERLADDMERVDGCCTWTIL